MYAFICESVLPSSPMTSLVLEQAFISLPSQQVSSSSTALSTLAEPSQPAITDSTWEEYQQAQTDWEQQQLHREAFQSTAPFPTTFKTPGAAASWRFWNS